MSDSALQIDSGLCSFTSSQLWVVRIRRGRRMRDGGGLYASLFVIKEGYCLYFCWCTLVVGALRMDSFLASFAPCLLWARGFGVGRAFLFLLLAFLLKLATYSGPTNEALVGCRRTLSRTSSLIRYNTISDTQTIHLVSNLRHRCDRVGRLSSNERIQLGPIDNCRHFF